MAELDVKQEKRLIERSLKDLIERGLVWIDWLEQGTLDALRRAIGTKDRDYHIFHFIGHGVFAEKGYLAFESPDGKLDLVGGDTLGSMLEGQSYLRMAILNA